MNIILVSILCFSRNQTKCIFFSFFFFIFILIYMIHSFSIPFSRSVSVFIHWSAEHVNYLFFPPGFIYLWFVLDRLFDFYVLGRLFDFSVLDCSYVITFPTKCRVIILRTFVTLTSIYNILYLNNRRVIRFKSD